MPSRVACSVGCKVRRARGPPARAVWLGPDLLVSHTATRVAASRRCASSHLARGARVAGGEQAHGSWRAHAARAGAVCVPCVRCPQYMCRAARCPGPAAPATRHTPTRPHRTHRSALSCTGLTALSVSVSDTCGVLLRPYTALTAYLHYGGGPRGMTGLVSTVSR